MGSSFRKITIVLLAAVYLLAMDVHLPVLQAFAWARMFITYAQQDDLATAFRDTFNGTKPCKLCCAIEGARQKSTSNTLLKAAPAGTDQAAVLSTGTATWTPAESCWQLGIPLSSGSITPQSPPVPPPRYVS